jgi:hypothetical protein
MIEDEKLSFVELFYCRSNSKRIPRAFSIEKTVNKIIVHPFSILEPNNDGFIFDEEGLLDSEIFLLNLKR